MFCTHVMSTSFLPAGNLGASIPHMAAGLHTLAVPAGL